MMNGLFQAHSGLRYLILLVAAIAVVVYGIAVARERPQTSLDRVLMSVFTGLLDLQLVLGVVHQDVKPGTREHFLGHLARDWPELLPRYREMYRTDAYLSDEAKAPILNRVAELKAAYDVTDHRRYTITPAPVAQQLSLLALAG